MMISTWTVAMMERRAKLGADARTLKVLSPFGTKWFWMKHVDVCTNSPKRGSKGDALVVDSATAEVMRFNLTARGWKVEVKF